MLPAKRLKLKQNFEEKEAQARNVELLKSIESFTTDLFKSIVDNEKGERENIVCSGLSVHLNLSMCALGARENTAKEMLDALHLTKDKLSIDFKNIITHLEGVRDIELFVANRIFADKSIVVKDNFKCDVSDFFSSDIVDVDFASQPKKAVRDINDWCAKKTNDKIKNILSEDSINSMTKMILTNAVYFKACWYDPFLKGNTSNKPFFIDEDTTVDVPTMHKHSTFKYKNLKKLDAECILIPYKNYYSFVIIKPKKIGGLEQLELKLQNIKLDYNDRLGKKCDFEYGHFYLALPKFKIESQINLNEYLPKLGMVEMFTDQANFKGISEEPVMYPPIHVDNVFQKAFIEVNEEGTEAGALTSVKLRGGGCPEYRDFKVDRPFLYRIVNEKCNLTLFSGRVIRPSYD